ncbi:hypothetical protein M9R32_15315, partial [Paenisporosarcina quisquiliarum]
IRKEFKEKSDENIFHHSKDSLSVDIATFIEGGSRTARGKRPHVTEIKSLEFFLAIEKFNRQKKAPDTETTITCFST